MINREPLLAPEPVLIRYLATFDRFFAATIEYSRVEDKAGMLLVGDLADALHNVPGMLWHCDKADAWRTPESMDAWMRDFPDYIRKRDAPERLITDSERILAAENGAQTLGLRADLADLDLCPVAPLFPYLDLMYRACLSMRMMRNYGYRPPAIYDTMDEARALYNLLTKGDMTYPKRRWTPWKNLEKVWTQDAQTQATANSVLAELLRPVPYALVHWSRFDKAQFRAKFIAHAESHGRMGTLWARFLER